MAAVWKNFMQIWAIFIPTLGHTASQLQGLFHHLFERITFSNSAQSCSVTRLGQFWKFMVSIKSSQSEWWIFGLTWKATLFMFSYFHYFLGNFWKNGQLFNLASGHSAIIKLQKSLCFAFWRPRFNLFFSFLFVESTGLNPTTLL